MKQIFFILFFTAIPIWANYCIQVVTIDRFNPNKISNRISNVLNTFENARIEERGSYLVLRVGDYSSYAQAVTNIDSVQTYYDDAYIRNCDYDLSRVVFPKDSADIVPIQVKSSNTQENNYYQKKQIKTTFVKSTTRQKYQQPTPTQTGFGDALWQDCQKCFAPIYLEEEEEEPEQVVTKREVKTENLIPQQKEKYKSSSKTDKDFWIEALDEETESSQKKFEERYDPNDYPTIDTSLLQ